ncbi:uncharacterized protein MCYG_00066 [Microsporum canis CBS 113480]|uniref:Uncharacterized protein n=1 Tax=Arthroderma otae (strain ATCC MYA-4605 / CBS 113480) TaxID=554155 RepID=C5FBJ4_ARTOC|nr:uncharacterized protein MCYG_00066 [Microsporum canis CBS 113480]EEQ27178.1 predicted protein [Microsporum canis CBS 113480]
MLRKEGLLSGDNIGIQADERFADCLRQLIKQNIPGLESTIIYPHLLLKDCKLEMLLCAPAAMMCLAAVVEIKIVLDGLFEVNLHHHNSAFVLLVCSMVSSLAPTHGLYKAEHASIA